MKEGTLVGVDFFLKTWINVLVKYSGSFMIWETIASKDSRISLLSK